MEAANNNVIEKLREAVKACEEISAKDLKSQKEEIARQFGELQKTVYEIINAEGVILANLQWKQETKTVNAYGNFYDFLTSEAEKIAMTHGYSEKVLYRLLITKNKYDHEEVCDKKGTLFRVGVNTYTYWTLK